MSSEDDGDGSIDEREDPERKKAALVEIQKTVSGTLGKGRSSPPRSDPIPDLRSAWCIRSFFSEDDCRRISNSLADIDRGVWLQGDGVLQQLRYRANRYVTGLQPWESYDTRGKWQSMDVALISATKRVSAIWDDISGEEVVAKRIVNDSLNKLFPLPAYGCVVLNVGAPQRLVV